MCHDMEQASRANLRLVFVFNDEIVGSYRSVLVDIPPLLGFI